MTWDPRPASPRWTTTVETDRPRAWRNRTALCGGAAPKCRAGRPRRAVIALDVLLSNSVLRRPSRPVLANRPIEPPAGRSPSTCRRVYRGPGRVPKGISVRRGRSRTSRSLSGIPLPLGPVLHPASTPVLAPSSGPGRSFAPSLRRHCPASSTRAPIGAYASVSPQVDHESHDARDASPSFVAPLREDRSMTTRWDGRATGRVQLSPR